MTVNEIRKRYLDFFRARGHVIIPAAPLVPENDPTTLFVSSGMQPLLPYFLGQPHPEGTRVANSQLSFRAGDIEEIGDNRHTTTFEMLGNWSFGDYFKKEQISWFYEFLTAELQIPRERLWVTCFEGDASMGLKRDTESAELWKSLGIPEQHIHFYPAKKNWWSRSGTPDQMPAGEPGGTDTEVFYDFGTAHDPTFGPECHPNCDCGRFMEIGNSVFMEFQKQTDGTFKPLPKQNVDFGGGLERLAAATLHTPDVFRIDTLWRTIAALEQRTGAPYDDAQLTRSFRIVADHIRGAVFMISDRVTPSNTEQGYILRRLIRRAIAHIDRISAQTVTLSDLVDTVVDPYRDSFPKLVEQRAHMVAVLTEEEDRFRKTLAQGMKEFERGTDPFILFSTYGFPIEMTIELAHERGRTVDLEKFRAAMEAHQELSRRGAEQKFKGGLADHSETSVKYHTATHLLHKALKMVLGPTVEQRGSNITPERLRFDFAFDRKMTDTEKQMVEDMVNHEIQRGLAVNYRDMPLAEAEKLGAIGLFEEKYGDTVRVYQIGDFSLEFCGGPHVSNTAELGAEGKRFSIQKEEAVAAGVRRIKAVIA